LQFVKGLFNQFTSY